MTRYLVFFPSTLCCELCCEMREIRLFVLPSRGENNERGPTSCKRVHPQFHTRSVQTIKESAPPFCRVTRMREREREQKDTYYSLSLTQSRSFPLINSFHSLAPSPVHSPSTTTPTAFPNNFLAFLSSPPPRSNSSTNSTNSPNRVKGVPSFEPWDRRVARRRWIANAG